MSVLRRGRVSVLIAVAIGLAAAGIAYAAIPGPDGVIHGCYQKNGQLRVIDSAAKCNNSEMTLNWNQKGTTGAAGSARAWAFVESRFNPPSAVITRGTNVVSVQRGGPGSYCVALDPSIDVRTVAVVITPTGGNLAATANGAGCILNSNGDLGIVVRIFDTTTGVGDDPGGFSLIVP